MIIKSRIFGYNIALEKPSTCICCGKKTDLEILDRVLDNDNGILRYSLVLKCHSCHEIFLITFTIGEENNLKEIEKESNSKPIKSNIV